MLEVAVVKAILINGPRKMPLDLGNIGSRYSRYTGRCWAREYLSSMAQDTLLKIGSSNFFRPCPVGFVNYLGETCTCFRWLVYWLCFSQKNDRISIFFFIYKVLKICWRWWVANCWAPSSSVFSPLLSLTTRLWQTTTAPGWVIVIFFLSCVFHCFHVCCCCCYCWWW